MKRFVFSTAATLILAPCSFAIIDVNENGVSDLWEKQFNEGELFDVSFDPQGDDDHDRWSNLKEAAAGTDPFDANPPDGLVQPLAVYTPEVMSEPDEYGYSYTITPEAVTVSWPTLVGKQYTLLFSPDLSAGSWIPIGDSFIGNGSEITYGFTIYDTDKRFWRVAACDVDSDSDELNDYEEHVLGTNPAVSDSDWDGLTDHAEILAGSDPVNQDTDGDGIPDSIDGQPLSSSQAFPDQDGDGIPDGDDPEPENPRGPAPTLVSETVTGNPTANFVSGEQVRFVITVSNPGGSMPSASDLAFYVNGAEKSATITATSDVPPSTRRFLLSWDAETTDGYPSRTLQNLTLRFRDSQQATSWFNLARIDVAEWEGIVAMSPVYYSSSDQYSVGLKVDTHLSGRKYQEYFGNKMGGANLHYRGPVSIPIMNQETSSVIATFHIPAGIKSPMFMTRFASNGVMNSSIVEAGDYSAFPHNSLYIYNNSPAQVRFDWSGIVTDVPGNSIFIQDYGTVWGEDHIDLHWWRDGQMWPLASTSWAHASAFTTHVTRYVVSCYDSDDNPQTAPRVSGVSNFVKLPASITPHMAGTPDVPGMPIHPLAIEKENTPFIVGANTFHKVLFRAEPIVEEWTNGVKLRIARWGSQGSTPPEEGIHLYQTAGSPPLPMDSNGDILLSPTVNQALFESLTSEEGLTLFLKRDGSALERHYLGIVYLSKYQTGAESFAAAVSVIPAGIIPDWNRDGMINTSDQEMHSGSPWRFWVNDDDDSGETGGSDISLDVSDPGANPDWTDNEVDGIRDLIDFFPLCLELRAALSGMPESNYHYFIKHKPAGYYLGSIPVPALHLIWCPELDPNTAPDQPGGVGSHLKNLATARAIAARPCVTITEGGLRIPDEMLQAAKSGRGAILIESRKPTRDPLQIEIRRNDGSVICVLNLPMQISKVGDMFRYKFVMPQEDDLTANDMPAEPSNWPDAYRNDKHFVFVHGYNVNDTQSKGWGAEFFKRLFWSGSNARFSAFGWRGYQGQIEAFGKRITPDYQVNLDNAFGSAKSFKQFLDLLDGDKTVAAHSMGNIVVGSAMHDWGARPANYCMLNAAAAKECYDGTEVMSGTQSPDEQETKMVHQAWLGYPRELRASEWYNPPSHAIWPACDKRRTLTWKNRLRGVIENGGLTNVYHFYSSGEEVLNNPEANNPPFTPDDPFSSNSIAWAVANKTWAMQEKRKGYGLTGFIHTSTYGGWLPNLLPYNPALHVPDVGNPWGTHRMRTPSELPLPLTNQWLLDRTLDPMSPFFNRSNHATLYDAQTGEGTPGSNYARDHRNTLISEMIPCTTFAAGRNAFNNILKDDPNTAEDEERQFDMNALMKTDADEWPLSNENENDESPSNPASRPWLHSDIREKAFTHNWNAYKKFVEIGNLNEE